MGSEIRVPLKEFSTYYAEALKLTLPDRIQRVPRLRVSGFPFCGLKAAYLKMIDHIEPDSEASKDFYCDIGTAAHAVFQRFLGAFGRIYGDWNCIVPTCKTHVEFSSSNKCPNCGSEMEYEEFTVTLFEHISGHTDGLYKDKNGKFWVIDYKTSSTRVIEMQKRNKTLPYSKNVAQIASYVVMLEEKYGIVVEGWMLIYIARDTPTTYKVTGAVMSDAAKDRVYRTMYKYDRQYDRVLKLTNAKQLDYLTRNKPCKSYDYYLEQHKGFKACPLEAVCFTNQLPNILDIALQEYLESTIKPKLRIKG